MQHPFQGLTRQFAVGALAIALLSGGILLALRSMDVEREVRTRYDQALALSQQALQAGQLAAELHLLQTRMARKLSGPLPAGAAPEADVLAARTAELKGKSAVLAQLGAGSDDPTELARLDAVVGALDRLNARLVTASDQREMTPQAAGEVIDQSGRLLNDLEDALTRLVAGARDRTMAAAHRVAQFSDIARIGLLAFSGVTLLLGLLLAVLTARTLRANRGLMSELELVAREDPLTGVTNRRGLSDGLALEFARALRSEQPLAVVMVDLDHFKRYNDRRGHGAGDGLLRQAAQNWLKALRPTDLLARYGGEEFTLVLPGCPSEQAAQLVDRLRPWVPDHQTFSAGIALWDGNESAPELLQRADQALLQAKKAGRNRTMVAGREPQATLPLKVA